MPLTCSFGRSAPWAGRAGTGRAHAILRVSYERITTCEDEDGELLAEPPRYRGHLLSDLRIMEISWPEWCARHIKSRILRYPDNADELDIEPEWASEAALDPSGRLSLTLENDLRVTGWSQHAPSASWSQRPGRVLRVVLKPVDVANGSWSGFTAAPASQKAADWYWRKRGSFGAA
jgi:hypothetical protein